MTNPSLRCCTVAAFLIFAPPSVQAAETKPHLYALVSAIGSRITFVRMRQQVGSHMEPYQRFNLDVPGAAIDGAVLRGLERAILEDDPDAEFAYMKLNPAELQGVYDYNHGEVAIGKLASAFERMPERQQWHRIVVVTPRYVNSEREGLGSKLHGIGVYVRPIGGGFGTSSLGDDVQTIEPNTMSPEGEAGRSKRFLAPFFYAQVWVLEPRTLKVLETNQRYDFQRLYDPKSTALDIEDSIPPEKLAPILEQFVERSSANALHEAVGTVTVREKPLNTPPPR